MIGLSRFTLIFLALGTAGQAADPVADLRLLRTDPKTSGFLENALQDGEASATQIEDKLDALVKGGTLTELARFKQQFSPTGKILTFEKDRADIKIADGVALQGGISLELEPTVGPAGLVDLRYALSRSTEQALNRIAAERTNTAATVKIDRWEILSQWGDEKQATMLLSKFTGVSPTEGGSTGRISEVRCKSEIRWCEPSDLKTFERSTPETRSKAITWLLARSKPIASSGMRMRGGQRCEQVNGIEWIHDKNGWETSDLGWSLEFQCTVGPRGKIVDLQLTSGWTPLDAKRPPAAPEFAYELATTVESGTTLVVEPKTRPSLGAVPVIFITPTILILGEAEEETSVRSQLPKEGQLGTITYPVQPSLMRKLAEISKFNPNAKPGVTTWPALKDMLQNLGLMFPAGTSVSFNASECHVLLTHDLKGHQTFRALLDQNGLTIPQEDSDAE